VKLVSDNIKGFGLCKILDDAFYEEKSVNVPAFGCACLLAIDTQNRVPYNQNHHIFLY
jgi:hypothetical protein